MTRQDERRSHPRSASGFRVENESDGLITHVDNISCSGVLCHTRRPVAEMTKLEITLELPDPVNNRVQAEGVVIRCDVEESDHGSFKVAILYTKVNGEDFAAIESFVEHDLS
jgi:hypothetical protein